MAENITILGNGAMATVCSILLRSNGHNVTMWGAHARSITRLIQNRENTRLLAGVKIPAEVRLTSDDADCFTDATLILSAIPTQYMREVWTRLAPYVAEGAPIVSVSKGIEIGTMLRPTQVAADVLIDHGKKVPALVALSGPNIAGELGRYLPGMAVASCTDHDVAARVQRIFSTQWFRVYTNDDVIGVELAGAVKNVVALAAGILDGLSAGSNAKASLVTRGLVEITRLGVAMGAREETFNGLAGLGDLITTCVSPEGRNRHVGEEIGRGRKLADVLGEMASVAEGVPTTESVVTLADRYGVEMPITRAVHAVLFEGKDPISALSDLMTRDPKSEYRR